MYFAASLVRMTLLSIRNSSDSLLNTNILHKTSLLVSVVSFLLIEGPHPDGIRLKTNELFEFSRRWPNWFGYTGCDAGRSFRFQCGHFWPVASSPGHDSSPGMQSPQLA